MIHILQDGRGCEVSVRDQYGIRRRRIFKTLKQAQAFETQIKSTQKRETLPTERRTGVTARKSR